MLCDLGVTAKIVQTSPSAGPVRAWNSLRELRAEIADFKPDLVHAHYGSINSAIARLAWSGPLVVTFYGTDLNPGAASSLIGNIVRWSASTFAALTAVRTIAVSEGLRNRLPWRKNRCSVLPSGVDLELFSEFDKNECRESLGWDLDIPTVVFNEGNRPKVKGTELALTTMSIVREKVQNVRFIRLNDEMPERIPMILNAADCLILTSLYEGSPTIVKEALACGLPIVSSDVGDVRLRTAGVTPGAVTDRDPENIAAEMIPILENPTRSNGPSKMINLSTAKVSNEVLSIYRAVLS
jgi:teichuronic acid biosynthesis glycosyltransferase TuaC